MLPRDTMWYIAFGMAATTAATILFLSRGHKAPGEFRAQDDPPPFLQIVWPLLFLGPQFSSFLMVLAPGLVYGTILTLSFPYDVVFQAAGLVAWASGGFLVLWAARALGRFMTIHIAVAKDHELITVGPYARIRHPTYAGAIFLTVGISLVFLNVVLLVAALFVVAVANYRARKEERLLASPAGFGAGYRVYMASTGRFLPSLRRA